MLRIALVEDEAVLAEMYKLRLEIEGYECLVSDDGQKGLELIQLHKPDLVLLDLMLPHMRGTEILRIMRESDWGKDIKVIILTNISDTVSPDDLKQHHFERYIVKSNNSLHEMIDIIHEVLNDRPAAAA